MDKKYVSNSCENCNRNSEELVTVKDFHIRHGVDFVCPECFIKLEEIAFKEWTNEQE